MWLLSATLLSSGATAQAPEVEAPQLLKFVEAEYPPAALAARREGVVGLILTLSDAGAVTAVELSQSAGPDLDAAAKAAALKFVFSPARRGGVAVASRIPYSYEFKLPPPPPVGDVKGLITMPGAAGRPAVGVEVQLAQGASQLSTRTSTAGRFSFFQLSPGRYQLSARAEGIGQAGLPISVTAGQTSELSLQLLAAKEAAIDVTVRGTSKADQLRESAQAVQVVETEQAKQESADLGEVLAREQGVGVRRTGGLGSTTRFSLNGLTDDQIRLFLDGLPLGVVGYPFGVGNVPVNLIQRAEIYRGVVPIRFGSDALGGAVNLVSDDHLVGTHAAASYQIGSFGTHRVTLSGRHLDQDTGWFTRAAAFYDHADNDYPIDVEVADLSGQISEVTVDRFHDAYTAMGANLELGFVDRPWARRLLLRAFLTDFDKELQNNVVMTAPYGEVTNGAFSTGASLRYEQPLSEEIQLEALAGYSYTASKIYDVGTCVYDWYGACIAQRVQAGEMTGSPSDELSREHFVFGRLYAAWQLHPQHKLSASTSPFLTNRTTLERRSPITTGGDPLLRRMTRLVSGLEYTADFFEAAVENILFVKSYLQTASYDQYQGFGRSNRLSRTTTRFGFGDSLRYRFTPWLYTKGSYEWATRLPTTSELFGNGVNINENLDLQPELSHNINLGLVSSLRDVWGGSWFAELNGFLRETDQLISLISNTVSSTYRNVYSARSLGMEAAANWTSTGEYLALGGNFTYFDLTNTSDEGTFANVNGDHIPNRPYMFANANATLQFKQLATRGDKLRLSYNLRYVHEYYRGWESLGITEYKQVIPSQLTHSLAASYLVKVNPMTLVFTAEAQNIGNAHVYDTFGVQRPGRSFYFKISAEYDLELKTVISNPPPQVAIYPEPRPGRRDSRASEMER